MTQTRYRIGEVAEATGFPLTTLRYYEHRGVLPPPERSVGGQRVYHRAHIERLEVIARAKRLGLTLDEATVLAEAWQRQACPATHDQLVGLLDSKLAGVRERIAELTRFAHQLEAVYEQVAGRPAVHEACGPECGCALALAPDHLPADGMAAEGRCDAAPAPPASTDVAETER